MIILAIDTSCDDTSAAVTRGYEVISNVISSQVRFHKKYGGVVPMVAARLHEERIENIVSLALQRAKVTWKDVDAIAVTYGPGLAPALQVGIAHAKALATHHALPLYAINHMAGHIASSVAVTVGKKPTPLTYPSLALLVSGSHTELVRMESFMKCTLLGQNIDDAVGEAFDKVGRMLGLGYPGGKVVAKLAEQGQAHYALPVPMKQSGDLNFSYSGLKNAVRLLIASEPLTKERINDISASFQKVAIAHVLDKCRKALDTEGPFEELLVGGGVTANALLRKELRKVAAEYGVPVRFPYTLKLCTDNAAMIGVAAWIGMEQGLKPTNITTLDRVPYLTLDQS